jgi:hypothetical protein
MFAVNYEPPLFNLLVADSKSDRLTRSGLLIAQPRSHSSMDSADPNRCRGCFYFPENNRHAPREGCLIALGTEGTAELGHILRRRAGHQTLQLFQIADDSIDVAELTPDRSDRCGAPLSPAAIGRRFRFTGRRSGAGCIGPGFVG